MLFHIFSGLGDTLPGARRVCSGSGCSWFVQSESGVLAEAGRELSMCPGKRGLQLSHFPRMS